MEKAIKLAEVYIKLRNQLSTYTKDGGISTKVFSELLDVKSDIHRLLLNDMTDNLTSVQTLEVMKLINDKL